ncbi:MAG TPA: hypothetical protein VFP05_18165, partial [Thermomicrobiales bacterium]|nr:hypothetical protein [Thermomicrobiales bacterium]
NALQQTGTSNAQFGQNFGFTNGIQIPLGSPGSGNVAANQFVRSYPVEIDPITASPGINQQAPAGTYTSTITLTITALAPL